MEKDFSKIYDFLYAKDALNLYFYLFSNENLDENKKNIIKNLIYVIYMYALSSNSADITQYIQHFLKSIKSIEDLNSLFTNDNIINKKYYLYPIHEDLKKATIKEDYQTCFILLKKFIDKINASDFQCFVETKKYIDDILQKISNNEISQDELNNLKPCITQKINYLTKYLDNNDIEAYKTYFKVNSNEINSPILHTAIDLFNFAKGEIKFSELNQLNDLKLKTRSANHLNNNDFEKIQLTVNEQKEINYYSLKKIARNLLGLIIIIYFFIGPVAIPSYDSFMNTRNIYYLFPFVISIIFLLYFAISFATYGVILLRKKTSVNGSIGFISDIYLRNGARRSNNYYMIYFPKYGKRYDLRIKKCSKRYLKRKDMVTLIKLCNIKFIIPTDSNKL